MGNIFKKKSYKIKYEKNGVPCITQCKVLNKINDRVMIGSVVCSYCQNFISQDYENQIIICKKKQGS